MELPPLGNHSCSDMGCVITTMQFLAFRTWLLLWAADGVYENTNQGLGLLNAMYPAKAWLEAVGVQQDTATESLVLNITYPVTFAERLHIVTIAFFKAFFSNHRISIQPGRGISFWLDGPDICDLNNACLFKSLDYRQPRQLTTINFVQWTEQSTTEFYLNGAGMLELWNNILLKSTSGCWASSIFLGYIVRPSTTLDVLISSVPLNMPYVCCAYGAELCKKVQDTYTSMQGYTLLEVQRCSLGKAWCMKFWHGLGIAARLTLMYHICSKSRYVIGNPSDINVKIITMLSFTKNNKLPKIYSSSDDVGVWLDELGFAACSSEELHKERIYKNKGKFYGAPPQEGPVLQFTAVSSLPFSGCALQQMSGFAMNSKTPHNYGYSQFYPVQGSFSNCSMHDVLQQATTSYVGSLCCGHGQPSGVLHIQKHPDFQKCNIIVLTYIGDLKNMLRQPPDLLQHTMNTSRQTLCFLAVLDTQTARYHRVKPEVQGLAKLGAWTVVTVVNSPYWDRSSRHWSPRRQGLIFKLIGHRLFPRSEYIIWIDGKYRLRHDPRLIIRWIMHPVGDLVPNFAIFQHPIRNCSWAELQIEKGTTAIRGSDHAINMAVIEQLYMRDALPQHYGLLDSAVLVLRNTPTTQKFFCLLWSLSHNSTARDQLLFFYLLHKMSYNPGIDYLVYSPECKDLIAKHIGHLSHKWKKARYTHNQW